MAKEVVETKEEMIEKFSPEQEKARRVLLAGLIFKGGLRGGGESKIGVTRKNKSETKKAKKQAKKSRQINHKIANKKFRPTGSKKS